MHVCMWLVKHDILEPPVEFAKTSTGGRNPSALGRTPHTLATTFRGGVSPSQKKKTAAGERQSKKAKAQEDRVAARWEATPCRSSREDARRTLSMNTGGLFGTGRGPWGEGAAVKRSRSAGRRRDGGAHTRGGGHGVRLPEGGEDEGVVQEGRRRTRRDRSKGEARRVGERSEGMSPDPASVLSPRNMTPGRQVTSTPTEAPKRRRKGRGQRREEEEVGVVKHVHGNRGGVSGRWPMSEGEESVVDEALQTLDEAKLGVRGIAGMCCAGDALTIERSSRGGCGLFATQRGVKAGEYVAILSHGRVHEGRVARSVQVEGGFQQYTDPSRYAWLRDNMGWAGGCANEANTVSERNAAIVQVCAGRKRTRSRVTVVIASRDIPRYVEVLVDYGSGEWEHRQEGIAKETLGMSVAQE